MACAALAMCWSAGSPEVRALPLIARLAFAFCLVAAIVFGGAGTYRYRALATQVICRDDAQLLRKAGGVREDLMGQGAPASPFGLEAIRSWPTRETFERLSRLAAELAHDIRTPICNLAAVRTQVLLPHAQEHP